MRYSIFLLWVTILSATTQREKSQSVEPMVVMTIFSPTIHSRFLIPITHGSYSDVTEYYDISLNKNGYIVYMKTRDTDHSDNDENNGEARFLLRFQGTPD